MIIAYIRGSPTCNNVATAALSNWFYMQSVMVNYRAKAGARPFVLGAEEM